MAYAEFRACERAGIPFPGVGHKAWDDLDWWTQLMLVAYDQIRQIEELDEKGF